MARNILREIRVKTWINHLPDVSMEDLFSLCQAVAEPGTNFRMVTSATLGGRAIVVWEGNPQGEVVTEAELEIAIADAWKEDFGKLPPDHDATR